MPTYSIIDSDTHITEPPGVWVDRVPAKYREHVPHVVRSDEGKDVWLLDGKQIYTAGMTAMAGWTAGAFPNGPPTFEDMHPGAHDATARLKVMDDRGIWAQVIYPNVAGFGMQKFLDINDDALKLICVQAYNDFLRDWASVDPRRFILNISLPFWDVQAAVQEVERCAPLGHRAILFTGEPSRFGLPVLGDKHWDPLWSVAQETGLPIQFHIGSGDMTSKFTPERVAAHGTAATYALSSVELFLKNGTQVADLLLSGVLPRFPGLNFVSVESGIGWIPFVLEAVDHHYLSARKNRTCEWDMLPSQYFERQVYATFWFETVAPRRLLNDIPIGNLLFETDFPHPTCLFDDIDERIHASLGGLDAAQRHQLLWGNAATLYGVETP
jgi:predicted TIM-barrel fold metal-dependent hydrolase